MSDSTLMIVDGLNLAFRYLHAKSTSFIEDYIRVVDSLKKSYKAGKVIIACDKGSSSYRKSIYPEYKANRKERFENQTQETIKSITQEIQRVAGGDPRIIVSNVEIFPQENGILIQLELAIIPSTDAERLSIFFDQQQRRASYI